MHIAVFGAGAVGGFFGGRLALIGVRVIFIARGAHLRAMRQQGLTVASPAGDFRVHPVEATDDPASVGTVDAVLVAVKAWQVVEAADSMQPLVGPETFLVPLQNGVEAPEQLAAALGRQHVLGGLCRIISLIDRPGHIRHAGADPYVAFGELDGRRSERAERLRAAFEKAGVRAEIPDDIQAAMWEKFAFIASFGGVGAVTRSPAGVIRQIPETRRMLARAVQEIVAVAQARSIALDSGVFQRTMDLIDSLPGSATASMQRDLTEGRPSELESQNGAVSRMGAAAGVPTPVNDFIYHSLLPIERGARGAHESAEMA